MIGAERLKSIPYWGFWILLAYMPFHIFLSQSLSLVTGGLEVWKIAKDIVTILLVLFTICLVFKYRKGSGSFWFLVGALAVYGVVHLLVWALHTDIYARSAILGFIYNNRLLEFAIIGCGAVLLTPHKFVFSSLLKGVVVLSTIVAALGIVQFFLPQDILSHLGYSLERGARASFAIDDHPGAPRIMATLREPNALGAYLLVPLAAVTYLLLEIQNRKRQLLLGSLVLLYASAIILTQSRSAWLAAVLVVGLLVLWRFGRRLLVYARRFWYGIAIGLVVLTSVIIMQRDSTFFQRYIIHSNPDETVQDLDSNDLHWKLAKEGLAAAAQEPIGHGPGTAGIVSIQNPGGGVLTENYYIQLAYEIGLAGLAVFIAVHVWLYRILWRRRDALGYVLCATFWGYVLTNMLLHTWSNETVAAQWWLLAGIAVLLPSTTVRRVTTHNQSSVSNR